MFDKNTATGIFLISIILLIFNIFFAPEIPQENINSNVTSEQIENTSENTPLEIDNVIFKQEKNTETEEVYELRKRLDEIQRQIDKMTE